MTARRSKAQGTRLSETQWDRQAVSSAEKWRSAGLPTFASYRTDRHINCGPCSKCTIYQSDGSLRVKCKYMSQNPES